MTDSHPSNLQDTIVALATPQGALGALGIFRISGSRALDILRQTLPIARDLEPRRSTLLWLCDGLEKIDQCLVTYFKSPFSFTGEEMVEICCHGGIAVTRALMQLFLKQGARLAMPGEFSQRAFLNGKMDLSQAEGIADLIHAQTELSRRVASRQMQGALRQRIERLRSELIIILAHTEVGLDHTDDPTVGQTFSLARVEQKLQEIDSELTYLINSYNAGRIARQGFKVALLGRPNVGKSSLLNALLKHERAIVTDVAGTTRDTLEEGFDLFGVPVILVDTAGIRSGTLDKAECLGIQRTKQSLQNCDLACLILDSSQALTPEDLEVAHLCKDKQNLMLILNKTDLPFVISLEKVKSILPSINPIKLSCQSGGGIEIFEKTMYEFIKDQVPSGLEEGGEVFVTSLRHQNCLLSAQSFLRQALPFCQDQQAYGECFALELAQVLESLGEIIGASSSEDILSAVFSNFCIGK